MSEPALFRAISIRSLELVNRIVIAPMCQYSAENGCMNDWHLIHLGHLALSGAALVTIEATAVIPEGRITYGDVGLYSDESESAIGRVLEAIRRWSKTPVGIQLSHAGRKSSTEVPWKGGSARAGSNTWYIPIAFSGGVNSACVSIRNLGSRSCPGCSAIVTVQLAPTLLLNSAQNFGKLAFLG